MMALCASCLCSGSMAPDAMISLPFAGSVTGAGRGCRFPLSSRRGTCTFYQSTHGTRRGFCVGERRAGADEIRRTLAQRHSAQIGPQAVAHMALHRATLEDDLGVRPDAHAFIVEKAPCSRSPMISPSTWGVSPARTLRTMPDRSSQAITVWAATLSVC